jgi:hypothetical protein
MRSEAETSYLPQNHAQLDAGNNVGPGVAQGSLEASHLLCYRPHLKLVGMQWNPTVAAYRPLSKFTPVSIQGLSPKPLIQPNRAFGIIS